MDILDFQKWLDNLTVRDIEQIYCLYQAIDTEQSVGAYRVVRDGEKLYVHTDNNPDVLLLASNLAEKAFVDKLDNDFGGDYGGVRERYKAMLDAKATFDRLWKIS